MGSKGLWYARQPGYQGGLAERCLYVLQPRPRCQRQLPDIRKEEVPQDAKGLSTFPKSLLFVPNILGWHIVWISSSASKEEDSVNRLGLKCSVYFAENRNSLVV